MNRKLINIYTKTLIIVLFVFSCILTLRESAFAAEAIGETESPRRPVVYAESYTVEGTIAAGEDIIVTFSVKNESRLSSVNNVLLNVTCPAGAFFPSEGQTSQYYVSGIEAGGSVPVVVYMTAANNLPNGSYDVSYSISWQDSQRDLQYTGSGIIALSVMNNSMEIVEVSVPEQTVEGRSTYVSLRYSNTGTAELYSARIVAEGNIAESGRTFDIGTVRASANGVAELSITFTTTGSQRLVFYLEYEDETGEQAVSDAYATSTNVAAGAASNTQEFIPPEQEGDTVSQIADFARENAVIIIGAVAIICVIFIIITLLRRKKR